MAYKYLDQAGLRTVWDKIKQNFGLLDGISINGTLIEPNNKIANIPIFSNANTTSAGLVPPTASSSAIFLSGDGTWRTPEGHNYTAGTKLSLDTSGSSYVFNHTDSLSAAATAGSTYSGTLEWGGSFKTIYAGIDKQGHITSLTNKTITIPSNTAVASTAGNGGKDGLMSAADKEILDALGQGGSIQNIFSTVGAVDNGTYSTYGAGTSAENLGFKGSNGIYVTLIPKSNPDNSWGPIINIDGQSLQNQNAFSNVKVGSTTVTAGSTTGTLNLLGAGSVSISANSSNKTVTITGSTSVATTAANGLMSSSDKTKLDLNHYATIDSSTAETSTEKTATCPNFVLENGAWIILQYADVSNAASTFTLNVNGTGAEPVHYLNFPTGAGAKFIARKRYLLIYHDGHWDLVGDYPEPGYGLTWRQPGSGTTVKSVIDHEFLTSAGTVGSSVASSGSTIEVPYAKYNNTGHITAKGTHIHTINNLNASVVTTGTFSSNVLASTPSTNVNAIATRGYVDDLVANVTTDAAMFKGIASSATNTTATNPISSNYKAGHYWLVNGSGSTAGITIVGQTCYDGDMIFAIKEKTGSGSTADFTVVQQNISPMTDDDIATATPLT